MESPLHFSRFLIITALVLSVTACSGSRNPSVQTGSVQHLIEGQPDFMFEAVGGFDSEGLPVIYIDIDLIEGSLIYSEQDGIYSADFFLDYEVLRMAEDDMVQVVRTAREHHEITGDSRSVIDSAERYRISKMVPARPGDYRINITITDNSSDKKTSFTKNTNIFDPGSDRNQITPIRVIGFSEEQPEGIPITTYDIPGRIDSLAFQFYVSRATAGDLAYVHTRLLQFESDTDIPVSMSNPMPRQGSLAYRGINYNRYEVLEQSIRTLDTETGQILIEFIVPLPDEGNYRFEAYMSDSQDFNPGSSGNYKARDFSPRSRYFPEVKSVRQMARALTYLQTRRESEEMLAIENDDRLKLEMDRFWIDHLRNSNKARSVINLYFTRVEEANKQFSGIKEGWKTDMGMIYILFGPPWYVERFHDRIRWIYGYDSSDPYRVFHFRVSRLESRSFPFNHYVLIRDQFYHSVEYQRRQDWLTGMVLTRPF
jgi:GWxTD domain-containing protein